MGLFKKQPDEYTGVDDKDNADYYHFGTSSTESKFQKDYKAFMDKVRDNEKRFKEIIDMNVPMGIKEETIKKERVDSAYHKNFSKSREDKVHYISYRTTIHLDVENYQKLKKEVEKMGFYLDTKGLEKNERSFSIVSDEAEIIKTRLSEDWAIFAFEPSDKYAYLVEYIIGMGKG